MTYTPLPNDVFTLQGHLPITVKYVFPTEVVFSQEPGESTKISLEQFHALSNASIRKGAIVMRDGKQIIPEPIIEIPTPETEITISMIEKTHTMLTEIHEKETTQKLLEGDPPFTPEGLTEIHNNESELPPPEDPEFDKAYADLLERADKEGLTGSSNTHARLSPSDSKRWVNCTASIAFQEANAHRVVDSSSREADEGTEAHEWAAKTLMEEITISQIPEPFREPVEDYVLGCRDLTTGVRASLKACIEDAELGFDPPDEVFFVEEQIPLFYQPEETGTADWVSLKAVNGHVVKLYGRDYKHGAGVLVTTAENTQLAIYVYSAICSLQGAYNFCEDTMIDLAVVQPRHRESEYEKSWVISLGDLRSFCEAITESARVAREAAELVRAHYENLTPEDVSCDEVSTILHCANSPAIFTPSEGDSGACRWCKCKAFCDVRLKANTEGMELPDRDGAAMLSAMPELDKMESKLPADERISVIANSFGHTMDDAYLVNLVARKKGITSFLNDAEEYLEARLLRGDDIDGVKLVDGREGNRDWASVEAADTFLRGQGLKQEERYKFTLQSPAVAEKLLKDKLKKTPRTKSRFEELIVRSPAKKKLAISSDSRESVSPLLSAMPDEFEV